MTEKTIETKHAKPHRSGLGSLGIFISTLAVMIFICAFGYGYFELAKVNVSLMRRVTDLQNRAATNQNQFATLQQSVMAVTQNADKAETLTKKQEQTMSEWDAAQKGDLSKWHVAEAEHLTKLANQYLLMHNPDVALVLLQRALLTMQDVSDSNASPIRESITSAVNTLQAALSQHSTTDLISRLNELDNKVDQLPLPVNPVTAQAEAAFAIPENTPWWKVSLLRTWQTLRKLVVVRNLNSTSLPLVLPEEKLFLYQNLHAQLENAMWAVLHHNADIYKTSIERAMSWTQQYFVQDKEETKTMLDGLGYMHEIDLATPAVDLSATLQLFHQYLTPQATT